MPVQVVTTGGKPKAFSWSYSKLKNFESCPKRHFHVDVERTIREEESDELKYGNALHAALAKAIGGTAGLPVTFSHLQGWVDKMRAPLPGLETKVLVEQKLAIDENFGATTWFGDTAWYRGIADVVKFAGPKVALAADWKTGKIIEDGVQLALMAQCIFAHHPEVERIRTEFIWLKEDATSRADFSRTDMASVWAGLLPRVQTLQNAYQTANFPPKPGHLCKRWCPVEACPHHGI